MTLVQVVGGPYDGAWIELEEPEFVVSFIVPPHPVELDEVLEGAENLAEKRVSLRPTLTVDGWRVFWREPA